MRARGRYHYHVRTIPAGCPGIALADWLDHPDANALR